MPQNKMSHFMTQNDGKFILAGKKFFKHTCRDEETLQAEDSKYEQYIQLSLAPYRTSLLQRLNIELTCGKISATKAFGIGESTKTYFQGMLRFSPSISRTAKFEDEIRFAQ